MSYSITFSEEANKQLAEWQRFGQKKELKKILSLRKELSEHPTTGTGKVEALKGNLPGLWSRHINKKDRIIYSINDDVITVYVILMKGHYGDK